MELALMLVVNERTQVRYTVKSSSTIKALGRAHQVRADPHSWQKLKLPGISSLHLEQVQSTCTRGQGIDSSSGQL